MRLFVSHYSLTGLVHYMIWNNSLLFLCLNEDLESSIFTMRSNLPVFHHNTVRMVILSNSPACKQHNFWLCFAMGGAVLFLTQILNLSLSLVFQSDILKRQTQWCTNARVVRKSRPAKER